MKKIEAAVRFMSKFEVDNETNCWNWTASKFREGYGKLWVVDRTRQAHRFSYELHCGPIPEEMHVCHRCDNPMCVNPAHLWLGTNAQNTADRNAKGRKAKKMSLADVIAIRAATGISQTKLAKRYGISQVYVGRILAGDS